MRTRKHKKQHWTADSGATVSVTNCISLFESIDDIAPNKKVRVANNKTVDVVAIGTVRMCVPDSHGCEHTMLLSNVHYSPQFSGNLLSVDEMFRQHKLATVFRGRHAHFESVDGMHFPIAYSDHGQSQLHAYAVTIPHAKVDPHLYHRRFMHVGNAAMQRLANCGIVPPSVGRFDFSKCDACLQGGGHKLPFGHTSKRARPDTSYGKATKFWYFGQRISCDLCGPFPLGHDGSKYAIIFHDSYTKYVVVYTIPDKRKETVLKAFQRFITDHQSVLPYGVKEYWTDNGGEFKNTDMDQFCEEICVKRNFTVPYSSPQNPYAERAWGTLLRKVRTTIAAAGIEKHEQYWPDVIQHAALICNILPNDNCESSYEKVHGSAYDYSRLHVPLCLCYYLVPSRDREASRLWQETLRKHLLDQGFTNSKADPCLYRLVDAEFCVDTSPP